MRTPSKKAVERAVAFVRGVRAETVNAKKIVITNMTKEYGVNTGHSFALSRLGYIEKTPSGRTRWNQPSGMNDHDIAIAMMKESRTPAKQKHQVTKATTAEIPVIKKADKPKPTATKSKDVPVVHKHSNKGIKICLFGLPIYSKETW